MPNKLRIKLYKIIGININANEVRQKCFFNSKFVSVGKGSFINYFCQFHSAYTSENNIAIGDNCYVGMNVNFCCISHKLGDENQRAGKNIYGSISVGKGTWIGANSVILPNVKIGNGCVVGAGSIVTRDCEPNCLYAGNPARKIRELS